MADSGGTGNREDCVVAGAAGELRWLPDLLRAVDLWLGDKLVRWSRADGRLVEYHPAADRFSSADLAPMRGDPEFVEPRAEVTGRFNWPG